MTTHDLGLEKQVAQDLAYLANYFTGAFTVIVAHYHINYYLNINLTSVRIVNYP